MKIQGSNVNLYAKSSDKESIKYRRTSSQVSIFPEEDESDSKKSVQNQFKDQLDQLAAERKNQNRVESPNSILKMSDKDYEKISLLERLLSELTGKKIRFKVPKAFSMNGNQYDNYIHQTLMPTNFDVYEEEISFEKSSQMKFNATGSVTTEDGRSIDFEVNIQSSRRISFSSKTVVMERRMIDPLAINFDGGLPGLTDEKYSFDIDFDGKEDQISFLTKGSGFLSLDINGDGKINDGRELFGPKSGSGFKDLAAYDDDHNGWIDENDEIYNRLRIWTKDENGKDQLFALGEKGIGAIYLGSVASRFDLLGSDYELNGAVKESGVYLNENGTAGSIHHVDIQV